MKPKRFSVCWCGRPAVRGSEGGLCAEHLRPASTITVMELPAVGSDVMTLLETGEDLIDIVAWQQETIGNLEKQINRLELAVSECERVRRELETELLVLRHNGNGGH